jgi:two-component system, OmpR family, response regulator
MKILVVEDEQKMRRAIRRGLEHEGYAVDVAEDADGALSYATEYDYDAIVLDVMLPGADGFEICRDLRARERWAPILMLTARDAVDDRIRGLDAGADDYLPKPFDFGELTARLRALIRRGPVERPAVLDLADLSLDPAAHAVRVVDRELELSAREFALLEFLIRHAGEAVTRTQLLEHVWDVNYGGLSNVVDVYVGYLRKKLAGAGAQVRIRTVRGVGYALEEDG